MPAYDFGFVSLDIQWVNSEDSGVYTCRATNDYGEDSTSATVKCRGEKTHIVSHQNLVWFYTFRRRGENTDCVSPELRVVLHCQMQRWEDTDCVLPELSVILHYQMQRWEETECVPPELTVILHCQMQRWEETECVPPELSVILHCQVQRWEDPDRVPPEFKVILPKVLLLSRCILCSWLMSSLRRCASADRPKFHVRAHNRWVVQLCGCMTWNDGLPAEG